MATDNDAIAVFGAGAIGCYVGGMLQAAGAKVRYLGRESAVETLQKNGLRLSRFDGDDVIIPAEQIEISSDPTILSGCSTILLCVKSQDTAEAAVDIAAYRKTGAKTISLQNGVDNVQTLGSSLGSETVFAGMVAFNVLSQGEGRFHRATEGAILMADGEQTRRLAALLSSTGTDAETTDNMQNVLWGKLLLNLNNSLNVLSDVPLVEQLSDRSYRRVLAAMIREAMEAMSGAKIKPAAIGKVQPWLIPHVLRLPNWLFLRLAKSMLAMDASARSSMWDDLQKGRQPEIDHLNGVITRLAETAKTDAPVNRRVMTMVKEAFRDGRSPGISGSELLDRIESDA